MEKDRSPLIDENLSPIAAEASLPEEENSPTATDEGPSNPRGRPFERGKSGNPAGRPKGSRNRTSLAVEALLDGQAEAITQKVVELALTGDLTALRLCLERILPVRRERRIIFDMPPLEEPEDAAPAMAAIIAAVADGELSLRDAAELRNLVESFFRVLA
jgi:uncharacterized protein DUF5681